MRYGFPIFAVVFCLVAATDSMAGPARIAADRVNVRALPDGSSEVVCQLDEGHRVEVKGQQEGEWTAIVPPDRAELWIYGQLVRDATVAAPSVYVRSGPGISYRPVGKLSKGDRVTVRAQKSDWLRIAPPESCTVWVHTDFLHAEQAEAGTRTTPAEPPEPQPRHAADAPRPGESTPGPVEDAVAPLRGTPPVHEAAQPSSSERIPAVLEGRQLVSTEANGREVSYEGVVRKAGLVWHRPSRYLLVARDRYGRALSLCYLAGDEAKLQSIEGRAVRVEGYEYWVQGVRQSVVVPKRIIVRQ